MTQSTAAARTPSDSEKLNRLIRNLLIVYALAPGAIALVFFLAEYWELIRPMLTLYYVIAIILGAFIAFSKIWIQVRSSD